MKVIVIGGGEDGIGRAALELAAHTGMPICEATAKIEEVVSRDNHSLPEIVKSLIEMAEQSVKEMPMMEYYPEDKPERPAMQRKFALPKPAPRRNMKNMLRAHRRG